MSYVLRLQLVGKMCVGKIGVNLAAQKKRNTRVQKPIYSAKPKNANHFAQISGREKQQNKNKKLFLPTQTLLIKFRSVFARSLLVGIAKYIF